MTTKRLLVVPREFKQNLEDKIQALAISNWREHLILCGTSSENASSIQRAQEVVNYVNTLSSKNTKVLIPKSMGVDLGTLKGASHAFEILTATLNQLLRESSRDLKNLLELSEIDCVTYAHNQICKWTHGEGLVANMDSTAWVKPRVERWCDQFLRVDSTNGSSLATALLRQVEVMPISQMRAVVKQYGLPGPYGIVTDDLGKSWASVSVALTKSSEDAERGRPPDMLLPLHEAIAQAVKDGQVVRVVEDGLYSATELLGVIDSLMGVRKAGSAAHKPKSPALADPNDMYIAQQQWAYGCVTDYGQLMFSAMTRVWGFNNISILIQKQTKRIRVLSNEATSEMQALLAQLQPILGLNQTSIEARHQKLQVFRLELNSRVNPALGEATKIGLTDLSAGGAVGLCQRIGIELWRSYLQAKFGKIDPIRWDDDRIRLCGLGKDGLGLAFSFAHSLPKATTPLFWATGKVSAQDGNQFDWEPLFPNAL
jgi:hypothetical protein